MTRPTLTITRGLPGSGKTTWSRQQPGFRVSRDDLRSMLRPAWPHGHVPHERLCTVVQFAQIKALLQRRFDVICDDTNLHDQHVADLMALAFTCHAWTVIRDFTDVPVDECVARDASRPEPVGEDKIRQMWADYQAEQRKKADR
jgi:tRNA uridine 5-carbamoylmethylation protein Kti12